MKPYIISKIIPAAWAILFVVVSTAHSQNRDHLPSEFREYTNPAEVVTFDRTTPFTRALDVINKFAQKYRGKLIIDRAGTEGSIGISIPAMHWMDALKLILRVKRLQLIEQPDYYEIVQPLETHQQAGKDQSVNSSKGELIATTQSEQVRINAIFFEGNRRALQELGVDWSTITENVPDAILNQQNGGQSGQGGGGGGQGGGSGQQGVKLPNTQFNKGPFVQVNSKGAKDVSQDVFNALLNFGEVGNSGVEVQALFKAFEADNLGEILSSPSIKVLDGQAGRIQVGQDFSIKQRDFAGNVIEDFFSVGTILEVTPTVIDQNDTTFIHLDINAERSSAQPDPVSTIINKQQAETQALLLDGETTVIAGLYNTETTEVRRGVPILKDLPGWFFGLRYLFGYTSKDYQTRELVVLLQASLEPQIPERMRKDGFEDKYEILQKERLRMHRELKKGQKLLNDQTLDAEPEVEKSKEEVKAPQEKKEAVNKNPKARQKKNKVAKNSQAMNAGHGKKDTARKVDPEVESREVPLNFGSKNEHSSQEEQPSSPSKPNRDTTDKKETPNNTSKIDSGEKSTLTQYTYYIVGGSFNQQENAEDLKAELLDDGYDAMILQKEGSTILLVAYGGYNNFSLAKSELQDIQKYQNSGAWLYRAH